MRLFFRKAFVANNRYIDQLTILWFQYTCNCAGPGSQCCDVVLVKGRINTGKPQGVGIPGWGADREQMGRDRNMVRSVYEQPGTRVDGSCHSKEGSK